MMTRWRPQRLVTHGGRFCRSTTMNLVCTASSLSSLTSPLLSPLLSDISHLIFHLISHLSLFLLPPHAMPLSLAEVRGTPPVARATMQTVQTTDVFKKQRSHNMSAKMSCSLLSECHWRPLPVPGWTHTSCCFPAIKLRGHENISSPKKSRFAWKSSFLLTFKQTPIPPSQCCQQNNSTPKDEIASQRHSWWDPTALCAERVREQRPKQPTQKPTQACLTAEMFVILVDFQTSCARLENARNYHCGQNCYLIHLRCSGTEINCGRERVRCCNTENKQEQTHFCSVTEIVVWTWAVFCAPSYLSICANLQALPVNDPQREKFAHCPSARRRKFRRRSSNGRASRRSCRFHGGRWLVPLRVHLRLVGGF